MNKRTLALITIASAQLLIPGFARAAEPENQQIAPPSSVSIAIAAISNDQPATPTPDTTSNLVPEQNNAQLALPADNTTTAVAQTAPTNQPAAPAPKVTDVRFNLARANYETITPFVPAQAYVGIGYQNVIAEVKAFDKTQSTDAKVFDSRTRVSKALRDLYGYLDKAMIAKRYQEAKGHLETIEQLAIDAYEKGILADSDRDNVPAWIKSYSETIDALEAERTAEINQLRKDANQSTENKESHNNFDWQATAIKLGLKDDACAAIEAFEALDYQEAFKKLNLVDTQSKKSSLVQAANNLLTHLTQRAHFEGIQRTVAATAQKHALHPGASELMLAYQTIQAEKNALRKRTCLLVKDALSQAAYLAWIQKQIRQAAEHYNQQVVDNLGAEDIVNYANLSVESLHEILKADDTEQNNTNQ